ncbi:MAG: adenosylcobalamin-dependent ribonucleoside-diphosphate reductase [Magnetococcales bacterium]|nr:adenosylcobalamin-dependent ribonucleoside-diphosphate reductase [Magnetococcales bacterium]
MGNDFYHNKLQEESYRVWDDKYRLKTHSGLALDQTPDDTLLRVAATLSGGDDNRYNRFVGAMRAGCFPAGRILSNAGAGEHKPAGSLINCLVLDEVVDSMEGIMSSVKKTGLSLAAGCGLGIDFSSIRPKGALVRGAGAYTTGAIPFMEIFDRTCKTVSSAGGRRGALMGVMRVDHPDIVDFIQAKRVPGAFQQFNLSVGVTDDFMKAVKDDLDWTPSFTDHKGATTKGKTVKARWLWDLIMRSTYEYSDPGVLFLTVYNNDNLLNFMEEIKTTNPCGEQGLPPNGACLLGSIDVSRFVRRKRLDLEALYHSAADFTELLDSVVEHANLPLPEYEAELNLKRRHGMGILGFGTALNMLGLAYGSGQSINLLNSIMNTINAAGWMRGAQLAAEHGPAPVFNDPKVREEYAKRWIKKFGHVYDAPWETHNVVKTISEIGMRFTHHTSLAPTGTMAFTFGNNCSGGIEPTFAHEYIRNITVEGRKTRKPVTVKSAERFLHQGEDWWRFDTAYGTNPSQHLAVQAAAQKGIDSSVAKTINTPYDIPYDEFKNLYEQAWAMGCKGCTTFRPSDAGQTGVLQTTEELNKTEYEFIRKDGTSVKVPGGQEVEFEGELTSAANLYNYLNARTDHGQ